MIKTKIFKLTNILFFCLSTLYILTSCAFYGTAETTDAELSNEVNLYLGIVKSSKNINENFDKTWQGSIDRDKLIPLLYSAKYEEYDNTFLESEAVCIHFETSNETVWFAIEYNSDRLYSVYKGKVYNIENGEKLIKALGKCFNIDKYFILWHSMYEFNYTYLDNGSLIDKPGTCISKRYFYNTEITNERVIIPDTTAEPLADPLDVYSACDIAAQAIGLEVYKAYAFYDKYTSDWVIEMIDELECQEAMKDDGDGTFVFYDKSWRIVVNKNGEVVYYLLP